MRMRASAAPVVDDVDDSLLVWARRVVDTGANAMVRGQKWSREQLAEAFSAALVAEREGLTFARRLNAQITVDETSKEQQLEAAKATFELVRGEMEKDAKRAAKLEQKCILLTAGLQKRNGELCNKLKRTVEEVKALSTEAASYAVLHVQEERAAPNRIEYWLELVEAARTREKLLQEKFETLTRQLNA